MIGINHIQFHQLKLFYQQQNLCAGLMAKTIQLEFPISDIQSKVIAIKKNMSIHLTRKKPESQSNKLSCNPSMCQNICSRAKKYGKTISKKEKSKKMSNEWSMHQNNVYARLILQSMMHNIELGFIFIQALMNKITRTPQQIYAHHRKMLSQHRTNQQIIIHILGSKFQKINIRAMGRQTVKNMQYENKSNSDKSFNQTEINYLEKLMLSDSSPLEYENDEDIISTKICDLYDSQYWKQQSITWTSFENSSSSEENISIELEGEDNMFFQSQSSV